MALLNGSVLRPAMFLFLAFFLCGEAHGWNPEYAYGLPRQKRMCVFRDGGLLHFSSTAEGEECQPGAQRYIVVFGKEPRGSIGLMPIATSGQIYPPLILKWPGKEETTYNHLWHFTCVEPREVTVLESKIELLKYKGEITAKAEKDCLDVQHRALTYCQREYQGTELLESCPVQWGVE